MEKTKVNSVRKISNENWSPKHRLEKNNFINNRIQSVGPFLSGKVYFIMKTPKDFFRKDIFMKTKSSEECNDEFSSGTKLENEVNKKVELHFSRVWLVLTENNSFH